MAENLIVLKLYQELSQVKDSLIESLKDNQEKLTIANGKLQTINDDYVKSLKEINMLNLRISTLEKDAMKYKRLSSSKKIFLLNIIVIYYCYV
jgi:hypothetical protein